MRRFYSLILVVPFVLLTLIASKAGPATAAPEQPVAAAIAPVSAHSTAFASERASSSSNAHEDRDKDRGIKDGRRIFRYDTFGDEQLWTDVLRMHEVIATVPPATALAVGLKVDVEALPRGVIQALTAGQVDLNDPAVTVELLRLNAVVGVRGRVNEAGQLTSVGITCALCHSSVDDSFTTGIGKRLDGWATPT